LGPKGKGGYAALQSRLRKRKWRRSTPRADFSPKKRNGERKVRCSPAGEGTLWCSRTEKERNGLYSRSWARGPHSKRKQGKGTLRVPAQGAVQDQRRSSGPRKEKKKGEWQSCTLFSTHQGPFYSGGRGQERGKRPLLLLTRE